MDQTQESPQAQQPQVPSLKEAASQALKQAQDSGRVPAPPFPQAGSVEPQREAPPAGETPSAPEGGAEAKPAAKPADAKPADPDPEEVRKKNANIAWGLRQKEAELKQREAKLAEIEAREAKLKEERDQLDELKRVDEIELLERVAKQRGMTVEEVMRRAILRMQNNGEPTPDMRQSDLERELQEIKQALEERDKRDREQAEQAEQRQNEAARRAAMDAYRNDAAAGLDAEKHPVLATFDPAEVGEAALGVALQVVERVNQIPDIAEVLEYLEEQESAKFMKIAEARGYTKAEAQAAVQAMAEGREPEPPAAAKQPPLTNKAAAQRGSAPIDYRKMTERERIKAAAAEVLGSKSK